MPILKAYLGPIEYCSGNIVRSFNKCIYKSRNNCTNGNYLSTIQPFTCLTKRIMHAIYNKKKRAGTHGVNQVIVHG